MSRASKAKSREQNGKSTISALDPRPSTLDHLYALVFGLFLGLAILKFGNPVILDHKIIPPNSLSDFWNDAWPTHWAGWILLPLAFSGAILAFTKNPRWPRTKWLW